MVEYILKYQTKSIKSQINLLINELENIFKLEKIEILKSEVTYFPELKNYLDSATFQKVQDCYSTLHAYCDKILFLKNYINKEKQQINQKYRFADLFAGCGGLSIGLGQAGFNVSFVNEKESNYCESYYFNHKINLESYFVGDINDLVKDLSHHKENLENLDLVCGGPPCQGFSMANRQRIIDDPRNVLYKSFMEFLRETKPKFFLMENVKGMAHKIEEIISDFNHFLGNDYNISFSILNARDFGVPQNRERFFIIGNRIGIDSSLIFEDIKKQKKKSFVLKDAIENFPPLSKKSLKNKANIDSEDSGFSIRKFQYSISDYFKFINHNPNHNYLFNHKNRYNNERDIEIFSRLPQGANSLHESIKDIMPYKSRNHMFKDKYFKLDENQISKTITSHMKFDCNMYIHPTEGRGLSPREAARIQTFPDDYLFRGSQNNWYAQIGNAVPIQLAKTIGESIKKHLI